jgi:hypothetical protein
MGLESQKKQNELSDNDNRIAAHFSLFLPPNAVPGCDLTVAAPVGGPAPGFRQITEKESNSFLKKLSMSYGGHYVWPRKGMRTGPWRY